MCDQYKVYHVVGLEIRRYGMIVNFKYFIYWLFYQSSKGAITNQSAIVMFFFIIEAILDVFSCSIFGEIKQMTVKFKQNWLDGLSSNWLWTLHENETLLP